MHNNSFAINLSVFNHVFLQKPLLIGGKAMEYYGIRKAGNDIDFVVSAEDHKELWNKFPHNHKEIYGDRGVIVESFEVWNSICGFDYHFLSKEAVECGQFLVVSIYQLLFLKVLGMEHKEKYARDVTLIREYIFSKQYPKQ